MNNVWTSIACQAPCVARQARTKPLLQLFTGHARSIQTQCRGYTRGSSLSLRATSSRWPQTNCSFATTAWLAQEKEQAQNITIKASAARIAAAQEAAKANRAPSTAETSDGLPKSTLQPAQAVASHTEGADVESEVLLWQDYDPEGGMPLPGGELSLAEAKEIFGEDGADLDTANYIVSILYWRRMSGALIDQGFDFPRSAEVSREQASRGLEYVRSLDPQFDEQAAGASWVEAETLRLQGEIQERSMKLGLYKRDVEPEEDHYPEETEYGQDRTSQSALEQLRARNEASWEKEQAGREAKKQKDELAAVHSQQGPLELGGGVQPPTAIATTGPNGVDISNPQTKAWLAPVVRKPWVKYYEDQAMLIKDNTVPVLSVLARLGPSFGLMLLTIGAGVILSELYEPPPAAARLYPDVPPAIATMAVLTTVLIGSFIASRMPWLWRTYSKYFTIIPAYPNAISILGAGFRHDTFGHLAVNILALWLFGPILHDEVGRGAFLALFFSCGAVGGFATLTQSVIRRNWSAYIYGSSGCVLGVMAAACTLRPNGSITIMGQEIPVAAWAFLGLYMGLEAIAIMRGMSAKTKSDHVGHLYGMITGLSGAMYLQQRAIQRNKAAGLATQL